MIHAFEKRYANGYPAVCHIHPARPAGYHGVDTWICEECYVGLGRPKAFQPHMFAQISDFSVHDRRRIAMLVHNALDHLWESSPFAAPDGADPDDYLGCCPECCAPCLTISELRTLNTLDTWLWGWPDGLIGTSWWDDLNERVDREFLTRSWWNKDLLGCHT